MSSNFSSQSSCACSSCCLEHLSSRFMHVILPNFLWISAQISPTIGLSLAILYRTLSLSSYVLFALHYCFLHITYHQFTYYMFVYLFILDVTTYWNKRSLRAWTVFFLMKYPQGLEQSLTQSRHEVYIK